MVKRKAKPVDQWLAVGGIVAGILLFLLAKNPTLVVICVMAIFALLAHPVWTFWWVEDRRWRRVVSELVLILLCLIVGYAAWPPTKLVRGILVAGLKPSPSTSCEVLPSDLAIYFGNSVAHTSARSFTLIEIGKENLLYLERNAGGGLWVSATIRDKDGDVVATLKRNVFRSEMNSKYEGQSPNPQTLYVLNDKDQLVFFIEYLNPHAIKVLGQFYYPGYPPVIIEDDQQKIGRDTFKQACMGSFAKSAFAL